MQPPEPLRTRVFPEAGVGWRWAVVRVETVLREGVKPTRDQAREAAAEAKRELEKQ